MLNTVVHFMNIYYNNRHGNAVLIAWIIVSCQTFRYVKTRLPFLYILLAGA